MPLLVLSVDTYFHSIASTVPAGMESDGGFTLSHEFPIPPHEDAIFTIKHVYINVSGEGRNLLLARGENKEPTIWLDTIFPDLEEDLIISKRNVTIVRENRIANQNTLQFPRGGKKDDPDQIRFPITCYPINGYSGNANSNRVLRQANNVAASHYEFRGTHVCDIPLGRMKLKDNRITVRVLPRNHNLATFNSEDFTRRVRIRNINIMLEYK